MQGINHPGINHPGKIHSIESFGTVDGPGTRFVIFTQGCPMRCAYCHNPDTWPESSGTLMEPAELYARFQRNAAFYKNGGITVTGGEPLLQIDFLTGLFRLAKKDGVHTCIDTSGAVFCPEDAGQQKKLDLLMALTDLVMLDIKHIDPDRHRELTGRDNGNILAFASYLNEKKVDIWIRHVVVPGLTDDDRFLYELGYFIGQFESLKALDVLPYHTMGEAKYEKLGIPYRLAGVPAVDRDRLIEKKRVILEGIRKRRGEAAKGQ